MDHTECHVLFFTLDQKENHIGISYAGICDCLLGRAGVNDDDDSRLEEEMIFMMCGGEVGDVEGRSFMNF